MGTQWRKIVCMQVSCTGINGARAADTYKGGTGRGEKDIGMGWWGGRGGGRVGDKAI